MHLMRGLPHPSSSDALQNALLILLLQINLKLKRKVNPLKMLCESSGIWCLPSDKIRMIEDVQCTQSQHCLHNFTWLQRSTLNVITTCVNKRPVFFQWSALKVFSYFFMCSNSKHCLNQENHDWKPRATSGGHGNDEQLQQHVCLFHIKYPSCIGAVHGVVIRVCLQILLLDCLWSKAQPSWRDNRQILRGWFVIHQHAALTLPILQMQVFTQAHH